MNTKTFYAIEYQSRHSDIKTTLTCLENLKEVKKFILQHHKYTGKRYKRSNKSFKWEKEWKYELKKVSIDSDIEYITPDGYAYIPVEGYTVRFRYKENLILNTTSRGSEIYNIYKIEI